MAEQAKIPFLPQYGGFTAAANTASAGSQLGNVLSSIGIDMTGIQAQIAALGLGQAGAKPRLPSTYVQTTIPTESAISKTLDALSSELLGRQLSQEEKNKYYAMLVAEERKPTSATTTKQVPVGETKTIATTTGGLSEEQFLIEKIAGTDEARANKVLDAYGAAMRLFGGLK